MTVILTPVRMEESAMTVSTHLPATVLRASLEMTVVQVCIILDFILKMPIDMSVFRQWE